MSSGKILNVEMLLESVSSLVEAIHPCAVNGASVQVGELRLDSRLIESGDIFVAFKGDYLDGHDFISTAIARQPSCIVVHKDWLGLHPLLATKPNTVIIVVADQVAVMTALSMMYRQFYQDTPFIALTGSVGKTTLKTLLHHVLAQFTPTLASHGSFNNHLGVPMTLSRLNPEIQVGVAELGTNQIGDIKHVAGLVKPQIAIITGVSNAHLGCFGSTDVTAQAKGEILDTLTPGSVAVLNRDDQYFNQWVERLATGVQVVSFGDTSAADLQIIKNGHCRVNRPLLIKGLEAKLSRVPLDLTFEMPLLGTHNHFNGVIAIAAVFALGLTTELSWISSFLEQLSSVFKGVVPEPGRLVPSTLKNGIFLIDDTYNAAPLAVEGVVQVLAQCSGEKWLILGDMAELGENEVKLHEDVGVQAAALSIDQFWTLGPLAAKSAEAFAKNSPGAIACFQDHASLNAALIAAIEQQKPKSIAIKGAKSKKMGVVVQHLQQTIGLAEVGSL